MSCRILDQRRILRPTTVHTSRPRRCATSGRSRRCNFTAIRRQKRPDRAGEAAAAAAIVGHQVSLDFPAISGHFRPPHSSCGPFLQIPHRLKVTTKTNLADGWIKFSGHHSDCWTKVMVLMSSWSLGLSIDMWFVNFGHRLVSFPFLGCFG